MTAIAALTALKHVIGSAKLVHPFIDGGVVDEFRLMIDPVGLRGGSRMFADDAFRRSLPLFENG